jgi:hypothetical protein
MDCWRNLRRTVGNMVVARLMPPNTDGSEAMFMDAVIRVANMSEWDAHHIRPGRYGNYYKTDGLPGMPDLILIGRRGQGIIWAELKTEKGKLTDEQRSRLLQINNNGQEVYVWRPKDMQTIADRLGAWRS